MGLFQKMAHAQISPEDFVLAWMSSTSVREVSERSGIDTHACHCIATNMRAAGVELKSFRHRSGFQTPYLTKKLTKDLVDQLNKFILER